MLETVTQSLGIRFNDKAAMRTRLILKPGFYGPVHLSHEWSLRTAVYRIVEVDPRYAVLTAYADIEQALRQLGAWHGGVFGEWFVRALDSAPYLEQLQRIFDLCAERLASFGETVSHPTSFPEKLAEDELVDMVEACPNGQVTEVAPVNPCLFGQGPTGTAAEADPEPVPAAVQGSLELVYSRPSY